GDRAEIPSYSVDAVAIATQRRIVVNYPQVNQLRPMAEVSRAEVCALIYQALVVLLQVPPLRSDYIVNADVSIPSFSDISGHWAEPFIRGLASQGAIAGFADGTFKPDITMNRAAYAALLGTAFNLPFERPSVTFSDVPSNFWAAAVIDRAYRSRLLSGFEDGSFRPNQPVQRLQVLLSLVSGLKLPDADLAVLSSYDDQAAIPSYARRSIASATSQRLAVNYPQIRQLDPNRDATRAEVAAMVYQAMVVMGRSPSLISPYIVNLAQVPDSSNPVPSPSPAPKPLTVVLDPGHGGKDAGTTSTAGIREKDIVLPIALKTAAALRSKNVNVVLTRADDRFIELATRVQIAAQSNAAVFVSIHGNATSSGNADANGLETYHYTQSTQGEELAQAIHNSILKSVNISDRRVRSANFYVLRMTAMPSALVEVGFLSGRVDSANLVNPAYQQQLAEAIALGILQYVQKSR
ncbi:MAG TPA: N-acetylmuramoyl-L-alanine amidase, partial [Chroococcidiopsis sp.]